MTMRRARAALFGAIVVLAALAHAPRASAEHFDASLSGPQIELKFKRLRDAREIDVGRPQPWIYAFSGPESATLEALSLRLVRDGFRIVSLQTANGTTVLRVARTELLSPGALERRSRELAKLAAISGATYVGAEVVAER